MPHEQAVPGACGVHVIAPVVVHQPVVGGVVDAAEGQRGSQVVALGGVVVDHVEDHLDALLVQGADHGLELLYLLAAGAAGGVRVVRGEEADGVVAPVVAEPALAQVAVGDELVHGHELDRGDPEPLQVRDHRRMGQAQVGAALLLRDDRVLLGQAADVRLVDHGLVVGSARRPVQVPVEERVHHDRARDVRRGVGVVPPVRVPEVVGEHRLAPVDVTLDRLGVRVEQQLGRVAAVPVGRVVRAVHPVPVPLARADARQVPVPDETVHLVQVDPGFPAVVVEQAEFDPLGYLGEQAEVGAGSVIRGAQRVAVARPYGSCRQMFPIPRAAHAFPIITHLPAPASPKRATPPGPPTVITGSLGQIATKPRNG